MTNWWPTHREKRLIEHFENGNASAVSLLKSDFGGELPKDLDIVNPPDYEVTLSGMASDPLFYLSATLHSLKNHWGKSGFLYWASMPKLALSILVGSALYYMMRHKGYVRPELNPNRVRINDFWAAVRLFDESHNDLANTIAHETFHTLQAYDKRVSLSSAFSNNRTALTWLFKNKEISEHVKYLSAEYEVQARLHTILTNAYIQHQKTPLTKYELWACLISQGMTPPQSIINFAIRDPECMSAFRKYPTIMSYVENHADASAVTQLNHVRDSIDDKSERYHLWNDVLPWLYGDILELWGDRLGHVRMGHTHNIQLREIFMKAAHDTAKEKITPDAAHAKMIDTANMMRREDALSLMTLIVRGDVYKEQSPISIRIKMGHLRILCVHALSKHTDVTPQDVQSVIMRATGNNTQNWQQDMQFQERTRKARTISIRRRSKRVDNSMPDITGFTLVG